MEKQLSRTLLLSAAFILLMVVSNALEEALYTKLPGFDFYASVAVLELATFAAAAALTRWRDGVRAPRKAPLGFYLVLGVSMALSQSLGKLANKYCNFTVSTIFKCSKALPTMLTMACLCGRRYGAAEVLAAATMGLAAACFALGAADVDVSFNVLGIALNLAYLVFQAAQVALQDAALRDHGASVEEAMLFANLFGLGALGAWTAANGELLTAVAFFGARPRAAALLLARNLSFYAAVRYYMSVIKEMGGVTAVTVGIVRKIVTILCSLLFFAKPWSPAYGYGLAAFAAALAQEVRNVSAREKLKQHASYPDLEGAATPSKLSR
mmetsp:Transcript_23211/g.69524  ORF Transcript_23211/g.69524 Transcript_23211/m.69524 type:complete len:325 (+) Transcript_23211:238-1212(+)